MGVREGIRQGSQLLRTHHASFLAAFCSQVLSIPIQNQSLGRSIAFATECCSVAPVTPGLHQQMLDYFNIKETDAGLYILVSKANLRNALKNIGTKNIDWPFSLMPKPRRACNQTIGNLEQPLHSGHEVSFTSPHSPGPSCLPDLLLSCFLHYLC